MGYGGQHWSLAPAGAVTLNKSFLTSGSWLLYWEVSVLSHPRSSSPTGHQVLGILTLLTLGAERWGFGSLRASLCTPARFFSKQPPLGPPAPEAYPPPPPYAGPYSCLHSMKPPLEFAVHSPVGSAGGLNAWNTLCCPRWKPTELLVIYNFRANHP